MTGISEMTETDEQEFLSQASQLGREERREFFRWFRDYTGVTLVAFGEACGLTNPMLSMFENGKSELSDKAWGRVVVSMNQVLRKNRAQLAAKNAQRKQVLEKVKLPYSSSSVALADELSPILQAAEAIGLSDLRPSEVERALGVVYMARMSGDKIEPPEPSALKRGLAVTLSIYDAIAAALAERRERATHSEGLRENLEEQNALLKSMNTEWKKIAAYEKAIAAIKDEQRKLQLATLEKRLVALENLQSVDDPIIAEIMESYRREIAELQRASAEKDKLLEEINRTSGKK